MKGFSALVVTALVVLLIGASVSPCFAQGFQTVYRGRPAYVPDSSVMRPGHIHTNYFIVNTNNPNPAQPPPGTETPGSLACVYKLVSGPSGCPVNSSTNVPTGGVGAIAIVDAGYYPTAKSDLHAFSSYFGIPDADFHVVYANGKRPPEYGNWEVEEALDIEWAHAMAPKAKLFLVESVLCTSPNCNTDPTWEAVKVASNLVAQNGGGVISMSWGDAEWAQERNFDHFMTTPGVVYFAASGDSGVGVSIHPGASPNVVSVGGTYFNRDNNGDFVDEVYGGGGGDISPYEPRPAYQNTIKKIVGSKRGYPDVASDFCCAAIYLQGWGAVGGTSWASPTMAGIVNSAGSLMKSSHDELTMLYKEYDNAQQYAAYFYDITQGDSACTVGWDECAGIGSVRTYKGK